MSEGTNEHREREKENERVRQRKTGSREHHYTSQEQQSPATRPLLIQSLLIQSKRGESKGRQGETADWVDRRDGRKMLRRAQNRGDAKDGVECGWKHEEGSRSVDN